MDDNIRLLHEQIFGHEKTRDVKKALMDALVQYCPLKGEVVPSKFSAGSFFYDAASYDNRIIFEFGIDDNLAIVTRLNVRNGTEGVGYQTYQAYKIFETENLDAFNYLLSALSSLESAKKLHLKPGNGSFHLPVPAGVVQYTNKVIDTFRNELSPLVGMSVEFGDVRPYNTPGFHEYFDCDYRLSLRTSWSENGEQKNKHFTIFIFDRDGIPHFGTGPNTIGINEEIRMQFDVLTGQISFDCGRLRDVLTYPLPKGVSNLIKDYIDEGYIPTQKNFLRTLQYNDGFVGYVTLGKAVDGDIDFVTAEISKENVKRHDRYVAQFHRSVDGKLVPIEEDNITRTPAIWDTD